MPVSLTYPGVYVQEVPSGVRTIAGVGTSVALFISYAKQGPLNKPVLCLNFTDFVRTFGTDTSAGELVHSVRLFFDNGGTKCYVMRIASGATSAYVTLKSEAPSVEVLRLTAKTVGLIGETIRAVVTYNGQQPEVTFNLELFRWESVGGQLVKKDGELWSNLTMDPLDPRYAPTFLTQNSVLVNAAEGPIMPSPGPGFSRSGRPVLHAGSPATFRANWAALLGDASGVAGNRFRISVDGSLYMDVDLATLTVPASLSTTMVGARNALGALIKEKIDAVLPLGKTVQVSFVTGPTSGSTDATDLLQIRSDTGDVFILPAATKDLAVPLMLGTAQGGLEVSGYAASRPAPNGITFQVQSSLIGFAQQPQDGFDNLTLSGISIDLDTKLQTVTPSTSLMYKDHNTPSSTGNNDGVREKLTILQNAINSYAALNPTFHWKAELWGARLALLPTGGGDNSIGTIATANSISGATVNINIGGDFAANTTRYTLGVGGTTLGKQTPAAFPATDGNAPNLADYANAYKVVDKEVDLFNLLILPKDAGHPAATTNSLWGPASSFCLQRRAFLLMDGPMDGPNAWNSVQTATSPTTGVNSMRVGLVKDHSALFYPRLIIDDNGLRKAVGASGAIAGLMARIDSSRGVWKAPAGTEADLRGVVGLELAFSDQENGVLNPRGINTLRVFPNGILNWGARTMDGDDDFGSEWKYVPVRRLALFMEESLYRGLKWVVFEPNDEPLWGQIRLNVGAFMHSLFRQGAFQGQKPSAAYFVKCDSETTTQDDINRGMVNIWVGFAPLKPAEFVVLNIQQMAGQIQV